MRVVPGLLFACAGLALMPLPAQAATVTYTIMGKVIAGRDDAGLFGGGNLADLGFTARETFDPAAAVSHYGNQDGSGANGGWSTNGSSFAHVVLTIGAGTTSFDDYTSNLSSIGGHQFNSFVQSSAGPGRNDIGFYIPSPLIKADYTLNNDVAGLKTSYTGYYTLNDAAGGQLDFANFEVNSLSAVTSVPLPASAPLFGAALVALAAVGYRRRRRAAP